MTIPEGVTSIGDYASWCCSGLTSVTSYIQEPFPLSYYSGYYVFSNETYDNATLYVPEGTVDAYRATTGWTRFEHIEEISNTDGIQASKTDLSQTVYCQDGAIVVEGAEDCTVRVYDLQGRELTHRKQTGGRFVVSVPHAGTYLLAVQKDGLSTVRKLTVQP